MGKALECLYHSLLNERGICSDEVIPPKVKVDIHMVRKVRPPSEIETVSFTYRDDRV